MDFNENLKEQILEIVQNQIQSNEPPETKETLDRLKKKGFSEDDAKHLVGQCLAVELHHVFTNQKPFNHSRYIANLKNLPEQPFDADEE
ncbi:MAG: DUF1841 family protein [Nanoarchaeota archaeon]